MILTVREKPYILLYSKNEIELSENYYSSVSIRNYFYIYFILLIIIFVSTHHCDASATIEMKSNK